MYLITSTTILFTIILYVLDNFLNNSSESFYIFGSTFEYLNNYITNRNIYKYNNNKVLPMGCPNIF